MPDELSSYFCSSSIPFLKSDLSLIYFFSSFFLKKQNQKEVTFQLRLGDLPNSKRVHRCAAAALLNHPLQQLRASPPGLTVCTESAEALMQNPRQPRRQGRAGRPQRKEESRRCNQVRKL